MRVLPAFRRAAPTVFAALVLLGATTAALLYEPPPREVPGPPLLASAKPISEEEFRRDVFTRGGWLQAGREDAAVDLDAGQRLRFVRDGSGCRLVVEAASGTPVRRVRQWTAEDPVCRQSLNVSFRLSPDRRTLFYFPDIGSVAGAARGARSGTAQYEVRTVRLVAPAAEEASGKVQVAARALTTDHWPRWRSDGKALQRWRPDLPESTRPAGGAFPVQVRGGVLLEAQTTRPGMWTEVVRTSDRANLPFALGTLPDGHTLAVRLEAPGLLHPVGHLEDPGMFRVRVIGSTSPRGRAKLRILRFKEPDLASAQSVALLDVPSNASSFDLLLSPDGNRVALAANYPARKHETNELNYLRRDVFRKRLSSRLDQHGAFNLWTARIGPDRSFRHLGVVSLAPAVGFASRSLQAFWSSDGRSLLLEVADWGKSPRLGRDSPRRTYLRLPPADAPRGDGISLP